MDPLAGTVRPRPEVPEVPPVDAMRGGTPRVLVTGAAGRIGRHVVNELLERGY